ncbi:MAG: hypothetical protein QOC98_3182 [Frankiaceae bacterium]|nr:hypothetical protein [Frankiaceae bacterium]
MTLVLAAGLVLFALDVGAFRGMSDNGDYGRVMTQVGLRFGPGDGNSAHRVAVQYYKEWPQTRTWRQYPTSLVPIANAAVAIDDAVTGDRRFDLRFLGLIYLGGFLVALYGLLRATRRLDPYVRVGLAALGLFVLTDFAYIGYFHSLFSEPVGAIGLLGLVGGSLLWAASGRRSPWAMALLALGGVLLATSKTQYAPIALLAALVLFVVSARDLWRRRRADVGTGTGKTPTTRRRPAVVAAASGLVVALAILVGAAWSVVYAPQSLRVIQLWEATYLQVLPHAPDKVAAARELGLDPGLADYSGQQAHGAHPPRLSAAFQKRFPVYVPTQGAIVSYYVHHPVQFAGLMWRGRAALSEMRPPDIANETHGAPHGLPSFTDRRDGWSDLKHDLHGFAIPYTTLVLGTAFVAPAVAGVRERRRRRDGRPERYGPASGGALTVLATAAVAAAGQYVVVLLSDGQWEQVKHFYAFHLLTDLSLLGLLAWGGSLVARRYRPSDEPPGTATRTGRVRPPATGTRHAGGVRSRRSPEAADSPVAAPAAP